MKEGVLFEITKEQLETGMRGFPVGYCVTSYVDPTKGLTYVGRPISEMAGKDPLEVIYLLYHGEIGNKHQLEYFAKELAKRADCHPETLRHIDSLPKTGHPMDLFAAAFLIAGMYEASGDYREDCLRLIAKAPQIAAHVINTHAGWGVTPPSNPSLGYIENFLHMLKFPGERTTELKEAFRLFEVLHFDHCGGNLSTFVGKAVASGHEHMWGSITASMTALAGPLHGRANQDCLEFLQGVLDTAGENANVDEVEKLVRAKLAANEVVYGFGHAVLRVEDPRATVFYNFSKKHFASHSLIKAAHALRIAGTKVLKENPKISDPYPNVDAISGATLMAAGFPYPDYFTVLFGLSRCVGIAIQIVYERLEARGGKGVPIVRPLYLYRSRNHAV